MMKPLRVEFRSDDSGDLEERRRGSETPRYPKHVKGSSCFHFPAVCLCLPKHKQRSFPTFMTREAETEQQGYASFGLFCHPIARAWGPIRELTCLGSES